MKKNYDLMYPWLAYSHDLATEYRQCWEEGLDVEAMKPLFDAISALPMSEYREKLADTLNDMIHACPQRADYPYVEPDALPAIRAERGEDRPILPKLKPAGGYERQLENAWMGRICGCLLGKPVEGLKRAQIEALCREGNNYPLHTYMEGPEGRCYINHLNGYMPFDDDTNYTVMAAEKLIGEYGRDFTPQDVAKVWLTCQPMTAYCTAERVAFRNFMAGYFPPESAKHKNPFREWIGAQIRGDYFGYINPGDPETAADMAWRDASISHVKNGIYGEMWIAAVIAAAAVSGDVAECIRLGMGEIPEKSRLHEALAETLSWYEGGVSKEEAFARIFARFDEYNSHDWCHTVSNAMIVSCSLLYGEKDYTRSVCMAVEAGFDTDCNGATVGSVLGMMGVEIDESWRAPVCDKLETTLMGCQMVSVQEMAKRTLRHLPK